MVKSKNEPKVSEKLAAMGLEVYCPTVKEVRLWSDRKKMVEVPLFKSYVFLHITESQRQSAFEVPGVMRYLFWLGRPAVVRTTEMVALQKWLSDEEVEEVSLAKIAPGDTITIKKGVLKDHDAVVQQIGKKRVRLVIEGLGMVINLKLKEIL